MEGQGKDRLGRESRQNVCYRRGAWTEGLNGSLRQKSCYRGQHGRIDESWRATGSVEETAEALPRRRAEYRRKLIDQAVELLGYHRDSAIQALSSAETEPGRRTNTGRPARYDARMLTPWWKQIWQATDDACSRRFKSTVDVVT